MRSSATLSLKYRFILALLLAVLGCWGTAAADGTAPPFGTLTVEQLSERLSDKKFVLVNVHVPYEGELPSTDAFIPFDTISDKLDRLPADRDASIVLYCRSGRMSEIAARELARLGYRNVAHLAGGMLAWEQAGYPVLNR